MARNIENDIINNIDQEEDVDGHFGAEHGYTTSEQLDIPAGRSWEDDKTARAEGSENLDEHEKKKLEARAEEYKAKDTFGRAVRAFGATVKEAPSVFATSLRTSVENWPRSDKPEPFTRDDYKFYDRFITDVDRKNLGDNIRAIGNERPELSQNQVYELAFRKTVKYYDQEREDVIIAPIRAIEEAKAFKMPEEFQTQSAGIKEDVGRAVGTTVAIGVPSIATGGALAIPASYMYAQGSSYRSIRPMLDQTYPLMDSEDKDEIAFLASRTIGLATAPLEGIGNILQIRAIMGAAGFRRAAMRWFSATIGEGVTEYVQQFPEAMVMLRTLNPDLNPEQFAAFAQEVAPKIQADALKAGLVGTLSAGIVSTVGGGTKLTMQQMSKYISKEQADINENKNIINDKVGATIDEVLKPLKNEKGKIIDISNKHKKYIEAQEKIVLFLEDSLGVMDTINVDTTNITKEEVEKLLEATDAKYEEDWHRADAENAILEEIWGDRQKPFDEATINELKQDIKENSLLAKDTQKTILKKGKDLTGSERLDLESTRDRYTRIARDGIQRLKDIIGNEKGEIDIGEIGPQEEVDNQTKDFIRKQEEINKLKVDVAGIGREEGAPVIAYDIDKDGNFTTGTLDQSKRDLLGGQTVLEFVIYNPKTHGAPVAPVYKIDWGLVNSPEAMQQVKDVMAADTAEYLEQATRYYDFLDAKAKPLFRESLNARVPGLGDALLEGEQDAMLPGIAKQVNSTPSELRRRFGPDSGVQQATTAVLLKNQEARLNTILDTFGPKTNSRAIREATKPMLYKAIDQYYATMNSLLGHDEIADKALRKWTLRAPTKALQAEQFEKKSEKLPGSFETAQLAAILQSVMETGKTGVAIQKFKRYGFSDFFKELAMNNMLSGPATHAANFATNTVNIGMDVMVERPAAVVMSQMNKIAGRVNESTDIVPVTEALYSTVGFYEGMKEVLRSLYLFASDPGMSTPQGAMATIATRLDVDENAPKDIDRRVITSEAFRNSNIGGYLHRQARQTKTGEQITEGVDFVVDNVGTLLRLPSNMLGVGDKVFLDMIGYRIALNQYAARLAWQKAKQLGWNNKDIGWYIGYIKDNPDLFQLDQKNISQRAVDQAKVMAFRSDPKGKTKTAMDLLKHADRYGGWLILPFKNTPLNINREVLKRVPLLHMKMEDYKNMSNAEKSIADGKMFIATVAMTTIMWAIMNEPPEEKTIVEGIQFPKITGKGPRRGSPIRKKMEALGWQEYSIRTDDGYVSYKRFEPYSTQLAISAELAEIAANTWPDTPDNELGVDASQRYAEAVVGAAHGIANSVRSKSWLDNTFTVLDAITSDDERAGQLMRLAQRTSKNVQPQFPWANLENTMRRQEDPYMREARTWTDMYHNTIPGESENLAVRRNVWGDAQFYSNPVEAMYGQLWSPIYSKEFTFNKVDIEIARIVAAGGSVMGMPQREQTFTTNRTTGLVDRASVKLNAKRYEMFILLMNGKTTENSKSVLKENVKTLMKTDMYKSATDVDRAAMINLEITDRVNYAKSMMYLRDIELRNYVDGKTKSDSQQQLQQFEERQ